MVLVMLGQDYCRSGMHGLNEELGRHRAEEGKQEGVFVCDAECESVSHVLWDCPALEVPSCWS